MSDGSTQYYSPYGTKMALAYLTGKYAWKAAKGVGAVAHYAASKSGFYNYLAKQAFVAGYNKWFA